jgi:hypothetical protein
MRKIGGWLLLLAATGQLYALAISGIGGRLTGYTFVIIAATLFIQFLLIRGWFKLAISTPKKKEIKNA